VSIFADEGIPMKTRKKPRQASPALQEKLRQIENLASEKGIRVHYDKLEAAGLKLKGGFCTVRGEYNIFVDKRKSVAEKIEFIRDYIDHETLSTSPKTEKEETPATKS
jgi:hypothetical protein